ncbi:MAG: CbiX/SirB N-terminal domain-containing protein [Polyangiaceae bacterium]
MTQTGKPMTRAVKGVVVSGNFDGVILIAHGARDRRWHEPFERMRDEIASRLPQARVALSFMEFAQPTLSEAAADLAGSGARRVLVVPVFLSGGGHVANDVPALVAAEKARHPAIEFEVSGALGEEPEVAAGMCSAVERLAVRG